MKCLTAAKCHNPSCVRDSRCTGFGHDSRGQSWARVRHSGVDRDRSCNLVRYCRGCVIMVEQSLILSCTCSTDLLVRDEHICC